MSTAEPTLHNDPTSSRRMLLSQVTGPSLRLIERPIGEMLRRTASLYPTGEALVSRHQNIRWTWREMEEQVHRVARAMVGLGLRPGDRIGVWASNCAQWVLMQFACGLTGIVLVNVNPAYRSVELRYVLRKSRIKALVLRERDSRADYAAILEESRQGEDLPLEHVVFLDHPTWDDFLANGTALPPSEVSCEDVANIQYTSGTTGSPKGVLLTHRNLLNNAMGMSRGMNIGNEDRICAPVPLYHCFGCVIATLVSLVSGATLILPAAQFDARATLEAIHSERATAVYGVPTMFIAELEHPDFPAFDLTSLRTGVMAGSPCPIEIMRRVVSAMHCREITIVYGQTESSPGITMSHASDDLELRVQTVGCALPNTEVKVVSTETGETVPVGAIGELCTRGYLVMRGYDGSPEETAEAVDADGWLHTGDLAEMLPNGYFRMRGRAKDTIIRGGENIYPREVEEFLHTHPGIADVYVFGVPDARLGETVAAWVKPWKGQALTPEDIRAFCKGRIAYFKIPQYIRFVESFPMTVTNKAQKFMMRETEIRELGLQDAAGIETA